MKRLAWVAVIVLLVGTLGGCSSQSDIAESVTDYLQEQTNEAVDRILLSIPDESSTLRMAVTPEALDPARIADASMWSENLRIEDLFRYQGHTFREKIEQATWDGERLMVPANLEDVDVETGAYNGDMKEAIAGEDYIQYTVYFRAETPNAEVTLSMPGGFSFATGDSALLPAISLLVNGEVYTNDRLPKDTVVATCHRQVGDYYVGQVTLSVYIDGAHPSAVNYIAPKVGDVWYQPKFSQV